MFNILYILLLCCIMRGYGFFGELTFSAELPMDKLMKKYKKITNLLPGHDVEMQLELVGGPGFAPDNPQNKNLNLVSMKKLYTFMPQILSRSMDIVIPQHRRDTIYTENSPAEAQTQPTPNLGTLDTLHTMFEFDSNKESAKIEDNGNKRPVYMEDLKKAMDDFGKRYLDAKSDPLEDGKQPLLKKDLWMALGLKYLKNRLSGCPKDRIDNQQQQYINNNDNINYDNKISFSDIFNNISKNNYASNNAAKNLNQVLQVLQKNIRGIKINQNQPPPQNLQWLQVKIPSQVLRNRLMK